MRKTTKGYTRGRTLEERIAEHMKDSEFKKTWHELDPEFVFLESMIKAREKRGLTRTELAWAIPKVELMARPPRGRWGISLTEIKGGHAYL